MCDSNRNQCNIQSKVLNYYSKWYRKKISTDFFQFLSKKKRKKKMNKQWNFDWWTGNAITIWLDIQIYWESNFVFEKCTKMHSNWWTNSGFALFFDDDDDDISVFVYVVSMIYLFIVPHFIAFCFVSLWILCVFCIVILNTCINCSTLSTFLITIRTIV